MQITFHGAARTVTGSKHLITLNNGTKILLDCGMFQGMGSETLELNSHFGFNPAEVDYVILSHAHIDHVGLLPKLVIEGFRGKIFCTKATAALAELLLADSARIQENEAGYINKRRKRQGRPLVVPLYTEDDVDKAIVLMQRMPLEDWYQIDEHIKVMHTEAGHIIGSTCINLQITEEGITKNITFSGDVGRYDDAILDAPSVFPQADVILMESTYGNKIHNKTQPYLEHFLEMIVATCLVKKGKLIIPSFSVGRTQELLYALNTLSLQKRLPPVAYYVDSPLSVEATEMTKRFPELFNTSVQEVLKRDDDPFGFPGLNMIKDVNASKALNLHNDPCVIISSSGMAEAGRIKHHIANNIENSRNTIMIVGYCEPHSLGGRLKAGQKEVSIFSKVHEVNATVKVIESMSAHGDYNDLTQWLSCQNPDKVAQLFLVHGEYEVQQEFRERLLDKGFKSVNIPERHQSFDI
ncbi:MBL fold metallo-hydrolase [Taibaiella sp. KBW10]|uniref:MBL fold metallo-hydrolase RNA specificity domain-containing protein n=1 Tax=Taibaiella sp. KBW10 TaxID=2153357 RepID=UPI000F5AEDDE|nr:MBL fold metallo-hydrolase [Taibaiella sp. KBW10]RQO29977.1 MBL fold metallo-hydrolase [Taibaiella sp. KBW10]